MLPIQGLRPLLDRIDIKVDVPTLRYQELASKDAGEPSATIRQRVNAARIIQLQRFHKRNLHANARMGAREIRRYCTVSPAPFSANGIVYTSGTTPVPAAVVTLKLPGTTFARTAYTSTFGTFSTSGLLPGTYNVTVAKTGYTFASPAATITVGPNSTGTEIHAITP